MMRIAMVSPRPPVNCGVVDYTAKLSEYLRNAGLEILPVDSPAWGLRHSASIYKGIVNLNPDVVHIQYPTAPYGRGLAPQALVFLSRYYPTVVTIHEFSQAHPLRRIAIIPFAMLARHLVFTNIYEQVALSRWFPRVRICSEVIPIGSNIPFWGDFPRDSSLVAFFGLLRPNRGLEEFITLAQLSSDQKKPYRFSIIGSPQEKAEGYYHFLRQKTQGLSNLSWKTGLEAEAVAQELAKATFAYLHFPDGASERRASLLAALGNGLVVLTSKGPHTPPVLSDAVMLVQDPIQALRTLDELRMAPKQIKTLSEKARRVASLFSWDWIVYSHLQMYGRLVSKVGR